MWRKPLHGPRHIETCVQQFRPRPNMTLDTISVSPLRPAGASRPDDIPLVVDLDGTLVPDRPSIRELLFLDDRGSQASLLVIKSLVCGKAQIKAYLSTVSEIDYTTLPYNADILELIRTAKSQGKKVYLATASDRSHAEKVAQHVGLFDGVFASDGVNNLTGRAKATALVEAFGEGGFDYVGDRSADIPIWAHARKAFVVSNSAGLVRKTQNLKVPVEALPTPRVTLKAWRKALRVHQYAKNALVFVALLTSHAYSPQTFLAALAAFAAFSLCASSVYLLNDLVDLADDRKHPTKRNRPFASGTIPLPIRSSRSRPCWQRLSPSPSCVDTPYRRPRHLLPSHAYLFIQLQEKADSGCRDTGNPLHRPGRRWRNCHSRHAFRMAVGLLNAHIHLLGSRETVY